MCRPSACGGPAIRSLPVLAQNHAKKRTAAPTSGRRSFLLSIGERLFLVLVRFRLLCGSRGSLRRFMLCRRLRASFVAASVVFGASCFTTVLAGSFCMAFAGSAFGAFSAVFGASGFAAVFGAPPSRRPSGFPVSQRPSVPLLSRAPFWRPAAFSVRAFRGRLFGLRGGDFFYELDLKELVVPVGGVPDLHMGAGGLRQADNVHALAACARKRSGSRPRRLPLPTAGSALPRRSTGASMRRSAYRPSMTSATLPVCLFTRRHVPSTAGAIFQDCTSVSAGTSVTSRAPFSALASSTLSANPFCTERIL